jgi:hypothetical protein
LDDFERAHPLARTDSQRRHSSGGDSARSYGYYDEEDAAAAAELGASAFTAR